MKEEGRSACHLRTIRGIGTCVCWIQKLHLVLLFCCLLFVFGSQLLKFHKHEDQLESARHDFTSEEHPANTQSVRRVDKQLSASMDLNLAVGHVSALFTATAVRSEWDREQEKEVDQMLGTKIAEKSCRSDWKIEHVGFFGIEGCIKRRPFLTTRRWWSL